MINSTVILISKEYANDVVEYAVGKFSVERIEYHEPQGEGDAHYCDVYFQGIRVMRVFRPDFIDFKGDTDENT